MRLGTADVLVRAKTGQYKKDLDAAKAKSEQFGRDASAAVKKVGTAFTALSGAAVIGGFTSMIKSGTALEQQMASVSAVMRASESDYNLLEAAAKKMGETTAWTAKESAEALNYMGLAGWSVQKSIAGLPGMLSAASAAGIGLGETSDILTDTLTAMGMEISEINRLTDVMTGTTTRANTDFRQMGEAMKEAAPYARAYGFEIEEVSALLGIVADAGIKGSDAGTGLKNTWINNAKAAKILGTEATDLIGTLRAANAAQWDTNKFAKVYGKIAGKTVLNIAAQIDKYEALTHTLHGVAGETKKVADIKLDTLTGDFTLLKSVIDGVGISAFDNIDGKLRGGIQDVTQVIKDNKDVFIGFADSAGDVADNLGDVAQKMVDIVEIYDSVPSSLTGPAGYGLVGAALFGSNIGKFILLLSLTNDSMGVLNNSMGDLVDKHYASGNAIINLWDSIVAAMKGDVADDTYNLDFGKTMDGLDRMSQAIEDTYGVDYGNLFDGLGLDEGGEEVAGAAKELKALQKELEETNKIIKDSFDLWGNGYDIDSGGIDKMQAAIDNMNNARNNEALALARNIDLQNRMAKAVEDTYDIDSGSYEDQESAMSKMFGAESEMIANQATEYGQMFGMVGNLFGENSKEREAMHTAEVAFAGIEMALNLQKAVSNAIVSVTSAGQGDPYTAIPRVIAMAALMGGFLSQIGGSIGGGGGGGSFGAIAPTTGTILGGSEGSESASSVLDLLEDIHADEYSELQDIYGEMVDLNSNISGLVSGIVRSFGNFSGASSGVALGTTDSKFSSLVGQAEDANILNAIFDPGLAGINLGISSLIDKIGGGQTETSLQGSGLEIGAATVQSILDGADLAVQKFTETLTYTYLGWGKGGRDDPFTYFEDVDANITDLFTKVGLSMGQGIESLDKYLGTSIDMSQVEIDFGQINLMGLEGSEINEEINEVISAAYDGVTEKLFGELYGKYQKIGEGFSETMMRLVGENSVIMNMLDTSDIAFEGTREEAISFSQSLIDVSGGFKDLTTNFSSYYDAFFSEAEKQKDFLDLASAKLGDVALPETAQGFRDLVSSIDLSDEAGQKLYITLLGLADGADGYYDHLKNIEDFNSGIQDIIAKNTLSDYEYELLKLDQWYQAQIVTAKELGVSLDDLNQAYGLQSDAISQAEQDRIASELQDNLATARGQYIGALSLEYDQIQAEIDIKEDLIDTNQDLMDSFIDLKTDISDFQNSLVYSSGISDPAYQLSFAKSQLESAVQGLYSGDPEAVNESLKDIPSLSKDLIDAGEKANTDRQDQLDVLGYVQKVLNSSKDIAGVQVNRAQSTIDELASQTATLVSDQSYYQTQIDLLSSINGNILSLSQAQEQYEKAVADNGGGGGGATDSGGDLEAYIRSRYAQVLGNTNPDAAGLAYWEGELATSGGVNFGNFDQSLMNAATTLANDPYPGTSDNFKRSMGVPGFADGGTVYSPTLAYIGEGGEAEHITPDSQMQEVKELLREIRDRLDDKQSDHTVNKIERILSRITQSGAAMRTIAV